MSYALGIDTGGTFTDSAIVDLTKREVLSKAKSFTTKEDLKKGIEASIDGLDSGLFTGIKLVSLSTTLATNSVVEGKGSRVGLIMAVTNPHTFKIPMGVPAEVIEIIKGSHGKNGEVSAPLDVEAATAMIEKMKDRVDAFAVSGFFSIYNAEHELTLKSLIAKTCLHPVVCSHELSGDVGMLERAVTAVLNARLLPVIGELLIAIKEILHKKNINAPLMVVKGDGSLISEESAGERPVETVLSGPAASVVGGCWLSGFEKGDAIVVDMGGTTTDIGMVAEGSVAIRNEGSVIGGWQTRVKAVDMWTVGLGGDSKIVVDGKDIRIGPRRAIPICAAADRHPELMNALLKLSSSDGPALKSMNLEFYTLVKKPGYKLSMHENILLESLNGKVLHRDDIEGNQFLPIEKFVELGFIADVSFTPTDLIHLLEDVTLWNRAASNLALEFFAKKAGLDKSALAEKLHREIIEALKLNILSMVMHSDIKVSSFWTKNNERLLDHLLRLKGDGAVSANISLSNPIIAVGAPVKSYFPEVAKALGTELIIPEHAEVANAVGAVAGRVKANAEAFIRPHKPDGFIVVTIDGSELFDRLKEALAFAESYTTSTAERLAVERGGEKIKVSLSKHDNVAPLAAGWGDPILMELHVRATAVGKPHIQAE